MTRYDRLLETLIPHPRTCPCCKEAIGIEDRADAETYPAAVAAYPGLCWGCADVAKVCSGCEAVVFDTDEDGHCEECHLGIESTAAFNRTVMRALLVARVGLPS